MRYLCLTVVSVVLIGFLVERYSHHKPIMSEIIYPSFRRDDIVDSLHGRSILDAYRYLENPDSDETKEFIRKQNELSAPYIQSYEKIDEIKKVVPEVFNFERYSCPSLEGGKYFYSYNSGLQNQNVLFVQDEPKGKSKTFFDPNLLSEDGTIALMSNRFSKDGLRMVYALSTGGSDWREVKIRNVESEEDEKDVLKRVKFSCLDWTHDGAGFFYNWYPEDNGTAEGTSTSSNYFQKLRYHKIGNEQKDDIICAEFDEKNWKGSAEVSDCGNYVIMSISESCDRANEVWIAKLQDKRVPAENFKWHKIFTGFEAAYDYVTNNENEFLFLTNENAPMFKVVSCKLDFTNDEKGEGDKKKIECLDFVKEGENVLEWAAPIAKDKLILHYLMDVKSALFVHSAKNGEQYGQIKLDIGTVASYSGKRDDMVLFVKFQSFLTPGVIYRLNFKEESNEIPEKEEYFRTKVNGFRADLYETNQVKYQSTDGTVIPMFLTHRKGLVYDGSAPALLYGYGGFHISVQPAFSVRFACFLKLFNGVVAIANIRGGLEYGENWWKDGSKHKKQNCFTDFQSAAKYLITENITKKEKLTILGGSNGGLLVGACVNQRPDLFGAAIPVVGVMDMLRFHKFTIGHYWTSDYGDPDKAEDFEHVIKYSPLHNIRRVEGTQYPSVLVVTADHDDRVSPLHSLKYIAELQHKLIKDDHSGRQKNPLFIRVETKAGHGAGKPTSKQIDELVDCLAFLAKSLKLEIADKVE